MGSSGNFNCIYAQLVTLLGESLNKWFTPDDDKCAAWIFFSSSLLWNWREINPVMHL